MREKKAIFSKNFREKIQDKVILDVLIAIGKKQKGRHQNDRRKKDNSIGKIIKECT